MIVDKSCWFAIEMYTNVVTRGGEVVVTVDHGTATDGTAALVYPPETAPEMDRLRGTLGVDAADGTFTTDGRFVTVDADYEW